MPTNLPAEWNKYYDKYLNAKTIKEKIKALKEVIAHTPKNKATDKIRARFKRKMAELRKEGEKKKAKSGGKSLSIKKEGDVQVSIIGLANSGKSTFLKRITNSNPKIADYPYTTTEPEVGMLEFDDVKIQLVEIPSTFTPEVLSTTRTSDLMILLISDRLDESKQIIELRKLKREYEWKKYIFVESSVSKEELFRRIWNKIGMIRVYTKYPGKPTGKPMVMMKGSTVEEAAKKLHKDFFRYFKFAKITGPSANFKGQRVGLEHVLKDKDIVEIHLKK
ncbi:MAG: TGS domain-containing protein [Candidatus Aenigmarchaeota archaeon]|nr:TGS domain-containing protein [Candidatus Aenigmarchaeota archaeon]